MSVLESNLNKIIDKINICTSLTNDILGIEVPEEPSLDEHILYRLPNETTFNGSTTYIDTGLPQADLVEGYTVVIRMKSSRWGHYTSLFGDYGMSDDHRGIVGLQYVDSAQSGINNVLTYRHYIDDKTKMIGIPVSYVPTGKYHIMVCSYDGGTIGKTYVGDQLIYTNTYFAMLVPMNNLIIGRSTNSNTNRYFQGTISHFTVYDKCLSQEEITQVVSQIKEEVGE